MNHYDNARGAPIVVTHRGGLRFGIQLGAHELVVDQPIRGGGEDAGPTPLELLGASLGSCVALYVHKFLSSRGLPVEGLRVEVSERTMQNPRRIGEFNVRIIAPEGTPALYRPMLESVAHVCPAHNTLAQGASVSVSVEMTAIPSEVEGPLLTDIAR